MRSLNIGATGMLAQQLNVETISNNIANLNTTGFKRQRAEFQDLLYQSQRRVGSASSDQGTIVPAGVQVGIGVKAAAVYRISEQGNLTNTSNPLDIAIQGHGFFQVKQPDGTVVRVSVDSKHPLVQPDPPSRTTSAPTSTVTAGPIPLPATTAQQAPPVDTPTAPPEAWSPSQVTAETMTPAPPPMPRLPTLHELFPQLFPSE